MSRRDVSPADRRSYGGASCTREASAARQPSVPERLSVSRCSVSLVMGILRDFASW